MGKGETREAGKCVAIFVGVNYTPEKWQHDFHGRGIGTYAIF
jgi:hypothetical protein